MAISRRTATNGTLAASATAAITLPTGAASGDLLVLVIGSAAITGPEAPSGWSRGYSASAGSAQCCSVYTAPYSAALTLTFTNVAAASAWACNAYFEASFNVSLDGAPVAATNTTSNTTLPTGAPTTGAAAGDAEVLLYTWTSAATISSVAAGSTIDTTRANSTTISVAIGANNTASLAASTTVTAFSQTLSAANTRKTGVGLLLKSTVPATRQSGGVGLTVDVAPTLLRQPQIGGVAFNVDYVPSAGPVSYPRTVSATVAQSVALFRGATISRTLTATVAQSAARSQAIGLTRRVTVGQALALGGLSMRVLAVTQATTARLVRQVRLTRAVTQAQAATTTLFRGVQITLAATQSMAVSLRKSLQLMRRLTGTNRVQTSVRLLGISGRLLRASSRTQVRLLMQVRLARAITQSTLVGFGALPVQLRVVSTVQTRSLALGRAVSLGRLIAQAQAVVLQRDSALSRTAVQPTLATLLWAAGLDRTVSQSTAVTLELLDVTPRYEVLVTASVSQQLSLSSVGAGKSSKVFVVDTREAVFAMSHRQSGFAVGRRGVRFNLEER